VIIRDIMKGEVRSISPWARLEDALQAITDQKVQYAVVMEGSSIRGILSEDDLSELTEDERRNLRVKDRMTKTVACVSPDSSLGDAVQKITQYRLECLPVCQNGTLVGIITIQDLQKASQRT
jgi:CBS domain-containing protein